MRPYYSRLVDTFLTSRTSGVSFSRAVLATLFVLSLHECVVAQTSDDACFFDEWSGTCTASAVWVVGQHGLLRSPRANLLADVAAGIETCSSSFGDEMRCVEHRGTCEFDKTWIPRSDGFNEVGGCFPTVGWATGIAEKCLGNIHDVDSTVWGLIQTTAQCVAHTTSGKAAQSCRSDRKCAWTEVDSNGNTLNQPYCAPDPLPLVLGALGGAGIGALVEATTTCGVISLETPCGSNQNCAWRNSDENNSNENSGTCGIDAARVLQNAITSPALKAYLERVGTCSAADSSSETCHFVSGCVFGKRSTSTNIIPRQYGGDGGDGTGGWVGDNTGDNTRDNSCFPTYDSILSEMLPALGVATQRACGTLAPLFSMAERCASAASDRGKCDAVGACWYESASGDNNDVSDENNGQCTLDVSEAIESLLTGGDAAVVHALSNACAKGDGNKTKCQSAGATAANAGRRAGGQSGSTSGSDNSDTTHEASGFAYFVLFVFVFFSFCVAPAVAYANYLKNKGEDVCDQLPQWAHKYVPDILRPQTAQYESFVGQEMGDDL